MDETIEVEAFYRDGVAMIRLPDGGEMRLADAMRQAYPDMQFDDTTGLAVDAPAQLDPTSPAEIEAVSRANIAEMDQGEAQPQRGYQFGDIGSDMGNENLALAKDIFLNTGNVTRNAVPESVKPYISPLTSSVPDLAMAGLLGAAGLGEKALGYGAEVVDAGVRNAVEGLGFDWPYAPGTSARKLAGDVIGGLDASGAGAEGRMLGVIADAARPATRAAVRGVMDDVVDRLNQPGQVPTTFSNPIPGLLPSAVSAPADEVGRKSFGDGWGDVYHWSRSPDDFTEFDLSKSTGSTSRLGPHVGTQKAAEDRFNGWEEPQGFTIPLKADLSKPFINPSNGKPWTELDLEMFISALSDEHGIDRRDVPPMMRQRLAEQGFTHIPYINDVEDPGSMSHIMLTDRPENADAVLRSRFARFDPRRSNLKNLSAGVAATAGGGYALGSPSEAQAAQPGLMNFLGGR